MAEPLYPNSSRDLSETRRALAPDTEKAFQAFSQNVFADGALSAKTKQLIAVSMRRKGFRHFRQSRNRELCH